MPAQLEFFDMEANLPAAQNVDQPVPITLGPNWQPGDIRVFYQLFFQPSWTFYMAEGGGGGGGSCFIPCGGGSCFIPGAYPVSIVGSTTFGPNVLTEPAGFSSLAFSKNSSSHGTSSDITLSVSIAWRRLQAGDVDTFISYPLPAAMNIFNTMLFTVRGVDPSWVPSSRDWGFLANPASGAVNVVNSVTVPGPGTMVFLATSYPDPDLSSEDPPWSPAQFTGFSIGAPDGWTNLVATSGSGNTFFEFSSNPSSIAVAKSFDAASSTGTVTFQAGSNSNPEMAGSYIWFQAASDVIGTTGNAATVTGATAATHSSSSTVLASTGNASTASSASTAFNQNLGFWVSDPLVLNGAPVTGSAIRWNAVIPPGSTVTVETSINGGASWDLAINDEPVPRLKEGDTSTRSVLVRITMTRNPAPSLFPGPSPSLFPADTGVYPGLDVFPANSPFNLQPNVFPSPTLFPQGSPPRVTSLEVDVSTDASIDELVPIGFGMIDEVTTHATGGTTGAGSSTNVAGSTAVIGRGGGQVGGGSAIKIHANDLSYAIKRNVWQMPFTVPSGLLYTDAIKAMVLDRLPSQTAFNLSTTTRTTPLLVYGVQQGGDPWQDIQELAQAIGFEAFFDATGTFVCRPVPDPSLGEPVWQFDESANPVVAEATRDLSSDQTFNDIVVVGQSTSTANPFSAEAFDNNPASPTYILGPYGRVTQRLTFSLITSQDQAQDAANAALFNSLGAADTVTLTVVPQPALEPGDIVKVVCSNVKANGTYMINSMETPLSPADPQTLTCFRQSSLTQLGQVTGTTGDDTPTQNTAPPGTILTSNFFQSELNSSNTINSFTALSAAAGNCLVVWAAVASDDNLHYSNVTGGGVTHWNRIASEVSLTVEGVNWNISMWFGVVTNPGSNAVNFSTSGSSGGGEDTWVAVQEFTCVGVNSSTTWGLVGTQQGTRSGSAGTIDYPTLTPTAAGQLYVGGQVAGGSPLAGSLTPGYVFEPAKLPLGNGGFLLIGALYSTAVTNTAQTPQTSQSDTNFSLSYETLGALISVANFSTTT